MGSDSYSSSSSSSSSYSSSSSLFDPEKYGGWSSSSSSYNENDVKINSLVLKAVPMTSTGKRVGLNIARVCSFGLSEIKCKGKRISHNIIEVHTNKGPDYVLEWLNGNKLRPGSYGMYSPIDGSRPYEPSNMTLADLRKIMEDNPGYGDCKDHSYLWWEKIKQNY
jgi:hypothetical protein